VRAPIETIGHTIAIRVDVATRATRALGHPMAELVIVRHTAAADTRVLLSGVVGTEIPLDECIDDVDPREVLEGAGVIKEGAEGINLGLVEGTHDDHRELTRAGGEGRVDERVEWKVEDSGEVGDQLGHVDGHAHEDNRGRRESG